MRLLAEESNKNKKEIDDIESKFNTQVMQIIEKDK